MFKTGVVKKMVNLVTLGIGGAVCFCGISLYRNNEKFYKSFVVPVLHKIDCESAHDIALWSLKFGLVRKADMKYSECLRTRVFGLDFSSPVGLAAGFDKDGTAVSRLHDIGFSFVEVGSVTPLPQDGNEKPRIFRLTEDLALINRCGFNSEGHELVYQRLASLPPPGKRQEIIGVNLGKNKSSELPIQDYVLGVQKFGPVADYLVINVSSPNTPGLRKLQEKSQLSQLLHGVCEAHTGLRPYKPPLLLKIAPDLTQEERINIATLAKEYKIDGLIISNTTTSRPATLRSDNQHQEGGLSGKPLCTLSTEMIREMAVLTEGKIPIIGVGGVMSGKDAYEKIRAGASLIQVYTGFIYSGPTFAMDLCCEIEKLLLEDGHTSLKDAVGTDWSNDAK